MRLFGARLRARSGRRSPLNRRYCPNAHIAAGKPRSALIIGTLSCVSLFAIARDNHGALKLAHQARRCGDWALLCSLHRRGRGVLIMKKTRGNGSVFCIDLKININVYALVMARREIVAKNVS